MRFRRIRPTIRLRLTLLYTALFVTAGGALLAVNYVLVSRREHKSGTAFGVVCRSGSLGTGFLQGQNPLAGPPGNAALPAGCQRVTTNGPLPGPFPFQGPGQQQVQAATRLVTKGQDHTLHTLEVESGLALGLMAIASLGLGWLVAGRVLRPVHRITDTARRLSEETLHERIPMDGPNDELKELADTFDGMLSRLDRAFASQRRFVANASHELRTPLATERVLIDEALANRLAGPDDLRSILEDLRANNDRAAGLIDALLLLARSEQGVQRRQPVDLAALARQVADQAGAEAIAAGVEIRTDLDGAPLSGDPSLLERLVGNLVENAVRHNLISGGWAEVRTGAQGEWVFLQVRNSGATLAPEHVEALFEPFRRDSADRTGDDRGFGLGLSIVRSVVDAHGGSIDAEARPDGGLDMLVLLPRTAGQPAPSRSKVSTVAT